MNRLLNKSLLTNIVALACIGLSFIIPDGRAILLNGGLYALSGALTNWLAIHMLFEKVPFLYGSGIIPSRFEEFKAGIEKLIMEQFFHREQILRFMQEEGEDTSHQIDLTPLVEGLDYDLLFQKLLLAIKETPLAGMLQMMGGDAILEPMKEPFQKKMKEALQELAAMPPFQKALSDTLAHELAGDHIHRKVRQIVKKRLDELTPTMVKEIIQDMIRTHLGWLVVWGGVFGGLIGIAFGISFA